LKDIKTGEIVQNFGRVQCAISPADYAVQLWNGFCKTYPTDYLVYENDVGVFAGETYADIQPVSGTKLKVSIPQFSDCKYPAILKALWHDIQFAKFLNGVPSASILPDGRFPVIRGSTTHTEQSLSIENKLQETFDYLLQIKADKNGNS